MVAVSRNEKMVLASRLMAKCSVLAHVRSTPSVQRNVERSNRVIGFAAGRVIARSQRTTEFSPRWTDHFRDRRSYRQAIIDGAALVKLLEAFVCCDPYRGNTSGEVGVMASELDRLTAAFS